MMRSSPPPNFTWVVWFTARRQAPPMFLAPMRNAHHVADVDELLGDRNRLAVAVVTNWKPPVDKAWYAVNSTACLSLRQPFLVSLFDLGDNVAGSHSLLGVFAARVRYRRFSSVDAL